MRKVGGSVAVVIRKCMRFAGQAKRVQMGEEARRIADSGQRMQPLAGKFGRCAAVCRIVEAVEARALEVHAKNRNTGNRDRTAAVEDKGSGSAHAADRLTQRTRRQRPAIHHAASVADNDLDIARQAVVLQAVVRKNHVAIGMRRQQRPRRRDAVAADKNRATGAPEHQQRFVADLRRRRASADFSDLITRRP